MTDANPDSSAAGVVARLARVTNAHDVDGIVACFGPGYRNETPVHPGRGFSGREQVRTNWEHIFLAVSNLQATIIRSVTTGDEIWTEWEMSGIRRDGTAHLMCGVIIFGVAGGQVEWARFYLEPVDNRTGDINAAVDEHVGARR